MNEPIKGLIPIGSVIKTSLICHPTLKGYLLFLYGYDISNSLDNMKEPFCVR